MYPSGRVLVILLILLALVTIIVSILICHRLRVKGTSQDLKDKVRHRHNIYFAFYIIILAIVLDDFFGDKLAEILSDKEQYFLAALIEALRNLVGIPLAYIRLREKYVYQEFCNQCSKAKDCMKVLLCMKGKANEDD